MADLSEASTLADVTKQPECFTKKPLAPFKPDQVRLRWFSSCHLSHPLPLSSSRPSVAPDDHPNAYPLPGRGAGTTHDCIRALEGVQRGLEHPETRWERVQCPGGSSQFGAVLKRGGVPCLGLTRRAPMRWYGTEVGPDATASRHEGAPPMLSILRLPAHVLCIPGAAAAQHAMAARLTILGCDPPRHPRYARL